MKKQKIVNIPFLISALFLALTTTVYAYSPVKVAPVPLDYTKVIPIVLGGMLIIEGVIILLLSDIKRIVNVSFAVLVANAASFIIPRFALGYLRHESFYKGMFTQGFMSSHIIAAASFLVVSLIIELPIIYLMLRVFTEKKVRLMVAAATANIVTTAVLFVVENNLHRFIVQ